MKCLICKTLLELVSYLSLIWFYIFRSLWDLYLNIVCHHIPSISHYHYWQDISFNMRLCSTKSIGILYYMWAITSIDNSVSDICTFCLLCSSVLPSGRKCITDVFLTEHTISAMRWKHIPIIAKILIIKFCYSCSRVV